MTTKEIEELFDLKKILAEETDLILCRAIYLRFFRRWSWTKIAVDIGGGNTPDNIRRIVNRYFEKML